MILNKMYTDEQELFHCIDADDIDGAIECIENGVDPNTRIPERDESAFVRAVLYGDDLELPRLIQCMIEHGADPDTRTRHDDPMLTIACARDMLGVVQVLLNAHANPNIRDPEGMSPLMFASTLSIVECLLDAGADPNLADMDGLTVLHYACQQLNVPIIRYIFEHSPIPVNINIAPILGRIDVPNIIEALYTSDTDESFLVENAMLMMDYLIAHGADVNARNMIGMPVLLCECMRLNIGVFTDARLLYYLVEHGADTNAYVSLNLNQGRVRSLSALSICRYNDKGLFEYFLRLEPTQIIKDTCMMDVLCDKGCVVMSYKLKKLKQLLIHGANPNAVITRHELNGRGIAGGDCSILELAIQQQHPAVELLMMYGADYDHLEHIPMVQQVLQQWRMEQEVLSSVSNADVVSSIHSFIKPRHSRN